MDKKINDIIKRYSDNEFLLRKIIVTAFVRFNKLKTHDGFLGQYFDTTGECLEKDIALLAERCTIEDVINIFELAIPRSEKTTNGAVYTPKYIRDYIVEHVAAQTETPINESLCADIACGCGAFLYTLAVYIHTQTNKTFKSIFHNLYGIDISATSIERAKILLSLVALANGERTNEDDFNLYCGDTLVFDFKKLPNVRKNGGFDVIVGNPPYVRSKHINPDIKKNLSQWNTSNVGNADLYIPFFEIGMSTLTDTGVLGYITVNTFFKSVNARELRKFLSSSKVSLSIVDFGEQLVFKKKLAYTCMVFLSKAKSESLHYSKAAIDAVERHRQLDYSTIYYRTLDNRRGWHLNRTDILDNIRQIEGAGEALGDKYVIKNGIATLANSIYIFRPTREDNRYYFLLKEGIEYPIEKEICRDIIKPNILKREADIAEKEEKIITPYDDSKVIAEDFFVKHYPCAYQYLKTHKGILDARDKGKGRYDAWYAFGRTQAISDSGRKLLFPCMSDLPHFVYAPQENLMIYCGYAIYHDSEDELLVLKRILESPIFAYYIENTSKPYSMGYYSYAKNYVKNFGICPLNDDEKKYLLGLSDRQEIGRFLHKKYGLKKTTLNSMRLN